jgi:hypothetical protein
MPATEKIGIFWLSTRQLNRSIMGTSVWIILSGITRIMGLTVGPATSILGSEDKSGPSSKGSPDPRKILPSMLSGMQQVT